MLWTIYPTDLVFADHTAPRTEEVSFAGRTFLVTRLPDGGRRIERLISSDPADYLHAPWAPGSRL